MNLHRGLAIFVAAGMYPGLALSDTLACSFVQDCEIGAACVDLPQPQQAWLSPAADDGAAFEMAGIETMLAELYRSETATGFGASPSPNNIISLTVHKDGAAALSVQYAGASALFGNTMLGTCQPESE